MDDLAGHPEPGSPYVRFARDTPTEDYYPSIARTESRHIPDQIASQDGLLPLTGERVPKVSGDVVDEAMHRRFSDPMPGDRVHRFSYSAEWWLVGP